MNTQNWARQKYSTTFPPVTLCNQCLTVRVPEPGDICLPCVGVIVNRQRLAEAHKRTQSILWHVALVGGVIGILMTVAGFLDR